VLGTPLDVTLSELAIESFLPADAATAAALTGAAAPGGAAPTGVAGSAHGSRVG
jgi:nicotinamide mononucleotide (NMN) deamidase PncC